MYDILLVVITFKSACSLYVGVYIYVAVEVEQISTILCLVTTYLLPHYMIICEMCDIFPIIVI